MTPAAPKNASRPSTARTPKSLPVEKPVKTHEANITARPAQLENTPQQTKSANPVKQRRSVSFASSTVGPLKDRVVSRLPAVSPKEELERILKRKNLSDKELRESMKLLRQKILRDGLPNGAEVSSEMNIF